MAGTEREVAEAMALARRSIDAQVRELINSPVFTSLGDKLAGAESDPVVLDSLETPTAFQLVQIVQLLSQMQECAEAIRQSKTQRAGLTQAREYSESATETLQLLRDDVNTFVDRLLDVEESEPVTFEAHESSVLFVILNQVFPILDHQNMASVYDPAANN